MTKLQPINGYVLIKWEDQAEQKTAGGIIIPDTAKEKPTRQLPWTRPNRSRWVIK